MKAVVDASAVLAALEPDRPQDAVSLHGLHADCSVVAPALIASEIGNFIHHKNDDRFGADGRERNLILEAALERLETKGSTAQGRALAGELSEEHGLSFYDAEYLAAALQEDAVILITEDHDLLAAARKAMGPDRAFDWEGYRRRRKGKARGPGAA